MSDQTNTPLEDEVLETVENQFDHSIVSSCPQCGGSMAFNPEGANLKCQYCQFEKEIATSDFVIIEHAFEESLKEGVRTWNEDDVKTFQCKNCGAEIVVSPDSQAQFCNYCGSSHVIQITAENIIPPHYVVPFSVDEKKAGGFFKTWIGKRWFAPNDLKKTVQNNRLLGTYVPFWTYDSDTHSYYTAQRGDYYYVTRTRVVNGKTEFYQERHTRWTPVQGDFDRFYDDVLVGASNKVDGKLLKKVEPFDMSVLRPYLPEYLSGFYAEKYSVGLEEGWQDGKTEIDQRIESGVIQKIGGDTVRFLDIKTAYDKITFKHILLPIWLSSFNYKEKLYHFMINGQTGEVQGEYPKSIFKIVLLVLGISALIALFILYMNANGQQNF